VGHATHQPTAVLESGLVQQQSLWQLVLNAAKLECIKAIVNTEQNGISQIEE